MRTKLGVFADKLIEAGWLAAGVALPMLFSVHTEIGVAVSRVALVRTLALLMLLAWGLRTLEKGHQRSELSLALRVRRFLAQPLVLPAVAIAGVYLMGSLMSVWPWGSVFGSYNRRQGTYTTLSYIAIFLLIVETRPSRTQVERLLSMIVFASLPVSLLAFVQHWGTVPEPWSDLVGGRVSSSFGNPIFLAAYLMMIIPLTLRQAMMSWRRARGSSRSVSSITATAFYGFALLTQLVCLILTQSRGPSLGLLVGLLFFLLLFSAAKGARRLGLIAVGLALLMGLFLLILNLPETPLAGLRDISYLGRFGTIAEAATLRSRFLIWETIIQISTTTPLRTLVGYGPETTEVAFYPYLSPELMRIEGVGRTADRAHNATLNALITTGLIGVLVYLFLFGALFYYGFKGLGLVRNRRQQTLFAALLSCGGASGVLVPLLMDGTLRFAGIGMAAGLVLGLLVYVVLLLLGNRVSVDEVESPRVLLIALLSAVMAHFIEIQSGIAVTVTQTFFWVCAALLVVVGFFELEEQVPAQRRNKRHARSVVQADVLSRSLVVGLLLMTMAYALITRGFGLQSHFPVILLFLLTWLLGAAFVFAETGREETKRRAPRTRRLRTYFLAASGCLISFIPFHAASLRAYRTPGLIATTYYVSALLALVGVALALLSNLSLPRRLWRGDRWWIHLALTVLVSGVIIRTNLNVVRADLYAWLGQAYGAIDQWDGSIQTYERAAKLEPGRDEYYRLLGDVYLEKAQQEVGREDFWLRKAVQAVERAKERKPLDPGHYANLGDLYQTWADVTESPAEKADKLKAALSYYQRAREMAPSAHGELLREPTTQAYVSLARSYAEMNQVEKAIEQLEAAKAVVSAEKRAELDQLIATLEARRP